MGMGCHVIPVGDIKRGKQKPYLNKDRKYKEN